MQFDALRITTVRWQSNYFLGLVTGALIDLGSKIVEPSVMLSERKKT